MAVADIVLFRTPGCSSVDFVQPAQRRRLALGTRQIKLVMQKNGMEFLPLHIRSRSLKFKRNKLKLREKRALM